MAENELVVFGENGEIVECGFNRIDLQNPSTILSYCSDVKDSIGTILDSTAQMTIEVDELKVDEKDIAQISTFGEQLEESEKSGTKNTLIKAVKGLLGKVGFDAFKDALKEDNYATRFKEYSDLLDKVATAVENQKQNTLNDIELKKNIINEMQPLVFQLEKMIEVGLKDKEAYDKETESLKLSANANDLDVQNEIQYRTQISAIFNNKLNELEKALILYKEQIQSYRIQQNTDMELVMANESYLQDSVPLLKAQGSVMVFNKIQTKRLERQKALDVATNEAIVENAKQLQTNAQAAVDLSVSGRVNMETLQQLDSAIRNGIQIFRNGKKVKQQQNEKQRQDIKKLNTSLNQYNEELLNLIEGNDASVAIIENTPQKRIGG